jgi:hypothetical protein
MWNPLITETAMSLLWSLIMPLVKKIKIKNKKNYKLYGLITTQKQLKKISI